MFRRTFVASVLAVVLAGAALVAPAAVAPADAATRTVSAKTLLRQLPVKSESNSGYARSKFKHWVDTADRDRCDAREEVLLAEAVKKPRTSTKTCAISGGKWRSKYDGRTTRNKSSFDIDHMVPLHEAWGSGAKKWTPSTRQAFANDLGYGASLIAVSAKSNRSKGSRDVAGWLPPAKSYRCTYTKHFVAVKWRWGLSVNPGEKKAITKQLNKCSNVKVTKPRKATVKRASSTSSRPQASKPWNRPGPDLDCSDIRQKVRVYPPDYHRLDADGDGWGCVSYG
ncbi:HNH endonuclease family protein [Isoptericola cucumis]|uniref:HNH endonuclease family protein n=1 Tax=Isoptericola cucumis TaxID=1776856 RepID=UPI00320A7481